MKGNINIVGLRADSLLQDCTTLAVLWKVKRRDGVILGFTNHDQDIVFAPISAFPQGGLVDVPFDGDFSAFNEGGSRGLIWIISSGHVEPFGLPAPLPPDVFHQNETSARLGPTFIANDEFSEAADRS